jgi:hypothetical protein
MGWSWPDWSRKPQYPEKMFKKTLKHYDLQTSLKTIPSFVIPDHSKIKSYCSTLYNCMINF